MKRPSLPFSARAGALALTRVLAHLTAGAALARWDVKRSASEEVQHFFRASPGGVPTQVAFSQNRRYDSLEIFYAAPERWLNFGAHRGAARENHDQI